MLTITQLSAINPITTATTKGQVAVQAIDRAVRNSLDFTISPDGSTLEVLTTLGTPCQAWRVKNGVIEVSSQSGFHEDTFKPFVAGITLPAGRTAFFTQSARLEYGFAVATKGASVPLTGAVLPRVSGGSVATACS